MDFFVFLCYTIIDGLYVWSFRPHNKRKKESNMLDFLNKLFAEQLKLSADMWLILLMAVMLVAFAVSLIAGLVGGAFNKIKGNMKRAVQKPNTAVVQMKNMPASVKNLYKTARMTNAKPSALVTQQVCVDEPFKHSFVSKIWLVTLVATLICAPLSGMLPLFSEAKTAADAVLAAKAVYLSPIFLYILGGLLTMVGGIIGKVVYGGAVKTYGKFAPVIDGDQHAAADPAQPAYEQQATYNAQTYEPQAAYAEPQAAYAEPQAEVYNEQPMYAEPQAAYGNATAYDEPVAVMADAPQESDEEIRRRAREEAIAQAKAQQAAAQAQAQSAAQAQAQQAQQAKPAGGSSSADDVIAQIEKISREGAPRETMRDVATLLQKERAKPENKTPEQQKRLNEALSKLLKAMSAATKK